MAAFLFLASLFLFANPALTDVFSLWPFPHSGGSGSSEALNPKLLWSEPVTINGVDASLGISILDMELDACASQLKSAYPDGKSVRSKASLVFETPAGNGFKERLLLVAMPGIHPVMQFSMRVPDKLAAVKPDWPSAMPLPPSSTPLVVMNFPKRNSDYGLFSSNFAPSQSLSEISASFKANGWARMDETPASASSSGNGGVFLNSDSSKIAIVGVSSEPDGGSRGAIYMRPLK